MVSRALYLAYARRGELHYVGKVDRVQGVGAATRVDEHLRSSRRKREAWRWVWVVPIAAEMPVRELLNLERMIISVYRPPGNTQHNPTSSRRPRR